MERFVFSPKARWLILFFFLMPALVYTAQGTYEGAFEHSCDLQHDWVAGKMVHRGVNPYRVWLETPQRTLDYFPESDCPEPLPRIAFLNAPLNAFLMVPIQDVEWEAVRILWVVLNLVITPLTALVLLQLIPKPSRDSYIKLLLVVILFSWFGTRHVFVHGQVSMIVALLAFASLAMLYRGRDIPAGIFLGIALCKFTIIWALPLLFLAYRRFTALAIAIALQLLGFVLMSISTGESLIEIPRVYVDLMTEFTGQTDGVVSLSRWVSEIGIIPEAFVLVPGIALALWVTFGLYRHITFSTERHDLSSIPARIEANLFATVLILISLTFVYHRYHDMVIALIVVGFWLHLAELPKRTLIQERVMYLLGIATILTLFVNLIPTTVVERFIPGTVSVIEIVYTTALVATLGIVLWVAWKYRGDVGAPE